MMRVIALSIAFAPFAAGSGADTIDGHYTMNAESTIHAESSVGTFDRTVDSVLDVTMTHQNGSALVVVRHDSHECHIQGALAGSTITFAPGQNCPQSIRGQGFQAELRGALVSGSANIDKAGLRIMTRWDVQGTVKLGPVPIAVTGSILTTASGTREQ